MNCVEIAIEGFLCGLVACAGLAKWSMVWGMKHIAEDMFRNDM